MSNLYQNIEWLDHNAARSYPLTRDATVRDNTDEFELPPDFLVALYLGVPLAADIEPSRFFLRTIDVSGVGISLVVGYDDDGDVLDAAGASIARSSFTRNQVFGLSGIGQFYDLAGHLVIGSLSGLDAQPVGRFTFDVEGGRLEPDCIRPVLRGVGGLRIQSGSDLSAPIYGDVVLVEGPNVRLTQSGNQITVSAVSGENLNTPCDCDDEATLGQSILTVNGLGPDTSGNFPLIGSECLEIVPVAGGLQLIDRCSKPCCGCNELAVITRELERYRLQVAALENLSQQLSQRTEQMGQTVLASRLGDRPCFDCSSNLSSTTPDSTTTASGDSAPLPMTAAPCARLTLPEMPDGEESVYGSEIVDLYGDGAEFIGTGVGYMAIVLDTDTGSLQLIAVNDDTATYRAPPSVTLPASFLLRASTGSRSWPMSLTVTTCE